MSRLVKQIPFMSLSALLLVLTFGVLAGEGFTEESTEGHNHAGDQHDLAPAEVEGTLQTSVNNGIRYSGVFKGVGSSVEMRSRQTEVDGKISPRMPKAAFKGSSVPAGKDVTTANSIKTSLTINGKRIDIRENLNKGTVHFDPHKQVLTTEDLTAINGAYYDFEGKLVPLMEKATQESKGVPADTNRFDEHPRLDPANPLVRRTIFSSVRSYSCPKRLSECPSSRRWLLNQHSVRSGLSRL